MDARLEMVRDLDRALHGEVVARAKSPQQVWHELLEEVRETADSYDRLAYQHRKLKEELHIAAHQANAPREEER